jgi:hypothetical protein
MICKESYEQRRNANTLLVNFECTFSAFVFTYRGVLRTEFRISTSLIHTSHTTTWTASAGEQYSIHVKHLSHGLSFKI